MALFEGKTPAERNKMIAAALLPLLALIFVVRMFWGSPAPRQTTTNAKTGNSNSRDVVADNARNDVTSQSDALIEFTRPIEFNWLTPPDPVAGRNIFAYYVKQTGQGPVAIASVAPATPTPTPPIEVRGLNPASVYARTSGFTLQITGDKFTPQSRVFLDGQEMPTEFRSGQQLAANVPSTSLSAPGNRIVIVRTPDNVLYSNTATLNVMQPPSPTHTFIGMIARARSETALLKNPKGDLVSVQVNDIVEGRFRVASISERLVELVDKDLNIKHTLPYVEARTTGTVGRVPGSIQPPPPSTSTDDEEPD